MENLQKTWQDALGRAGGCGEPTGTSPLAWLSDWSEPAAQPGLALHPQQPLSLPGCLLTCKVEMVTVAE